MAPRMTLTRTRSSPTRSASRLSSTTAAVRTATSARRSGEVSYTILFSLVFTKLIYKTTPSARWATSRCGGTRAGSGTARGGVPARHADGRQKAARHFRGAVACPAWAAGHGETAQLQNSRIARLFSFFGSAHAGLSISYTCGFRMSVGSVWLRTIGHCSFGKPGHALRGSSISFR
jgi:hypothetical protein